MKYKNNDGFTLIEIILTVSILSIIILPLSSMFIQSAKINSQASVEYDAVELAQKYMEQIKSQDVYDARMYGGAYANSEINYTVPYEETAPFNVDIVIKPNTTNVEGDNKNKVAIPLGNEVYNLCVKKAENGYISIKTNKNFVVIDSIAIPVEGSIQLSMEFYKNSDNTMLKVKYESREVDFDMGEISENIKTDIYLPCDMSIEVNNRLDDEVIFNVKKEIASDYSCSLQVIEGKVTKKVNILSEPIDKMSDYILYDVSVKVKYKDNEIVNMEGYKVFDK